MTRHSLDLQRMRVNASFSYAFLRTHVCVRPDKSVSSGAREDNIAVVTPDQFVAGDNKVKVEG